MPPARSRCGPTRGSGPTTLIDTLHRLERALVDHHRHQCPGQVGDRVDRRGRLGRRSTTPTAARPKSPRRPDRPGREASRRPCAWWCAAPASPTPPNAAVAGLAAPRVHHRRRAAPPSPSTGSTATMPPSSSPSATSKRAPGSSTARPGRFFANSAWLACAVLAHNLIRWTASLGDVHLAEQLTVARTVRTQLLAMPGRLVNRSRRLRLPPVGHGPRGSRRARPASAPCRSRPDQPHARTGAPHTTTTR